MLRLVNVKLNVTLSLFSCFGCYCSMGTCIEGESERLGDYYHCSFLQPLVFPTCRSSSYGNIDLKMQLDARATFYHSHLLLPHIGNELHLIIAVRMQKNISFIGAPILLLFVYAPRCAVKGKFARILKKLLCSLVYLKNFQNFRQAIFKAGFVMFYTQSRPSG